MTTKFKGVMQSPVTPFKDDFSLDLPTFERLLDFHVRTGATAISWPHHKGESLNLTIAERKALRRSRGARRERAHSGHHSCERAGRRGHDGHWRGTLRTSAPTASSPSRHIFGRHRVAAIHAYFVRLCRSIELPVLSYNSPSYLAGVEITGDLISRLIEQLPNFVGVKEASFNSEKFLEISRAALAMRPDFAMLTGVEYLLPSVPLGGIGSYSAAGSICPNLCSQLFDACMRGDWPLARELPVQDLLALAAVPRPVPLLAQGRHGDDGAPSRADPGAVADRHRGAPGAYPHGSSNELGILETEPHGW